jgi:hypothetical protein
MELQQHEDLARRKRRVMDTSGADARRAVAEIVSLFAPWRFDLARFAARAERHFTRAEQQAMLRRCAEIEKQLLAARTELIVSLADAPRTVAGHSRVVDVEKALDNIEVSVKRLRGKLTQ